MNNFQRRRKKYLSLIFAILTLVVSLGLYFGIHSRQVAIEQARLLKEEQESQKIENRTFGYSTSGKSIDGYEIGNGSNTILLFASIHGDEVGTVDLLNRFIDEIKSDPSKISKNKRLIVIPIVNPDGYYDRMDKLNVNLVNLNLNFATSDWEEYGPEGTYAGPRPFSEIESWVIKQVVEQYSPSMMISYHAQAGVVTPEFNNSSKALAHWYADKTGYEYYDEWDYPGTATKWFEETTDKPAITVELMAYRPTDWEINKEALMELVSLDSLVF